MLAETTQHSEWARGNYSNRHPSSTTASWAMDGGGGGGWGGWLWRGGHQGAIERLEERQKNVQPVC